MKNQRRPKFCRMPRCGDLLKPRTVLAVCPSCRWSFGIGGFVVGGVIALLKWLI